MIKYFVILYFYINSQYQPVNATIHITFPDQQNDAQPRPVSLLLAIMLHAI